MKIHHLQGYIQSIYLVEYEDKFLLLDGCCRCDVKTIKQYIEKELGRSFSDLKLVIVTHMHPDHAGAADKLRQITGCKVATGRFSKQWYGGIKGVFSHWLDIGLTYYVAYRINKPYKYLLYPRKLSPDIQLDDQQLLPGFEDWQVVASQGHTDRDISLYHPETGNIYVGDSIVKVKQRFISPFPVHHPNQYKNTLSKFIALQPRKILLAHGGVNDASSVDLAGIKKASPKRPSATSHFLRHYLYRKLVKRK